MELRERAREHVLHPQVLHAHEVEDHAVGEAELRLEFRRAPREQPPRLRLRGERVPRRDDHRPDVVQAAPPGAARHLRVLPGQQPAKILPVVFSQVLEAYAPRGRVDAHRERLRAEQRLQNPAAEEHLHDLLDDGQQPRVVHAEAAPQELADARDLRELPVRGAQPRQAPLAKHVNLVLLRARRQVQARERVHHLVAPPAAEAEDHHGQELAPLERPNELHPRVLIPPASAGSRVTAERRPGRAAAARVFIPGVPGRFAAPAPPAGTPAAAGSSSAGTRTAAAALGGGGHFTLLAPLRPVHRVEGSLVSEREERFPFPDFVKVLVLVPPKVQDVLERDGALGRPRHEHLLALGAPDPVRELPHVRHGRAEQDEADVLGKHDDHLLPHHPALGVVDVVYLVEHHPLHVPDEIRAAVQHRAQNLRGHDQTRGVRSDADVAGEQTDVEPGALEVAELLVRDGLDRGGVNRPRAVLSRQRERVLRHRRLPGGRVRRHEHALPALETIHSLLLEHVQSEREAVREDGRLAAKRGVHVAEAIEHGPRVRAFFRVRASRRAFSRVARRRDRGIRGPEHRGQ